MEPVPAERWDRDALYDPNPLTQSKSYCRDGGFIRDIDLFDSTLFGIMPRDAAGMDPQQRLLLEASWEALERAGIVPGALLGKTVGVYTGVMMHEYDKLRAGQVEGLDGYAWTGSSGAVASGRLSYVLGVDGPSMTVDTACSSSLVALHLACQALRAGECELALVGGVALMLVPELFVEFSQLQALAPDGRCKPFCSRANGMAFSEGCVLFVVERLRDAVQRGDPVQAVMLGTAVTHNGRSEWLTAPSVGSQRDVMRLALQRSGLSSAAIDYVESHGTGTSRGDPVEAESLAAVYGAGRPASRPLHVGTGKGNLGHGLAAAGLTGVMKVVLGLQHDCMPKSLHAEEPRREFREAGSGLALATRARAWPRGARLRRAAVSCFGISGTNAHVVLEEAPLESAVVGSEASGAGTTASEGSSLPFVLSARSAVALRGQAERLAEHLAAHPEQRLADVAYSLATTRTHLRRRAAVVARTRSALVAGLRAVGAGRGGASPPWSVARGRARSP